MVKFCLYGEVEGEVGVCSDYNANRCYGEFVQTCPEHNKLARLEFDLGETDEISEFFGILASSNPERILEVMEPVGGNN